MPKTTRIREQDSGRTGLRIVEVINGDGTYTELAQAGDAALGLVELATTAEAVTGTDTERAVTPARAVGSLLARLQQENHYSGGLL